MTSQRAVTGLHSGHGPVRIIDQAEHDELIRRILNVTLNEIVPISALPPELLARIFTFASAGRGPHDRKRSPFNFTSWLNFTYVSQRWRTVALNTPSLWGDPHFLYPKWAIAMVERSGTMDLRIRADTSQLDDPAVMKEVFDNHASRIRDINLSGLTATFLSSIIEDVQPSSLRLRSLELSGPRSEPYSDTCPPLLIFPAHLLHPQSRLQSLQISHGVFPWFTQPLHHLTHLKIDTTSDRPSPSEFITALSAMPALKILDMRGALPLEIVPIESDMKVEFHELSNLRLGSVHDMFELLNVLGLISVPCTTTVRLSCEVMRSAPQLQAVQFSLGRFFSRMIGNVYAMSYYRLTILHSESEETYLAGYRNKIDPNPQISFWMTSQRPWEGNEFAQTLDNLIPVFPHFGLQYMCIDTDSSEQEALITHFGQSTTIKCLRLGICMSETYEILTHKPDGYEHLESAYFSLPFPALQRIEFSQASFEDDFEDLLDCLMERYERGAGVQKMTIWRCSYIGHDQVRRLREIVPDLLWDGLERWNSDIDSWDMKLAKDDDSFDDNSGSESWTNDSGDA